MNNFYPAQGNILEQTIVKDLKKKIDVSQEDLTKCKFRAVEKGFDWDKTKVPKPIELDLTNAEKGLLKTQVEKLDKDEKVDQNLLSMCLKIKELTEEKEESK